MTKPATPKDLLAPALLWALILFGCWADGGQAVERPLATVACAP